MLYCVISILLFKIDSVPMMDKQVIACYETKKECDYTAGKYSITSRVCVPHKAINTILNNKGENL